MIRKDQEDIGKGTGKGHNIACLCSHTEKAEVYSNPFTTSALKGGGWSAHHGHFTWGAKSTAHHTGSWVGSEARLDRQRTSCLYRVSIPRLSSP